jgi:hypothetical protein
MTSLITKPQATRHGRVFAPACTNHRRWRAAARAEQQSGNVGTPPRQRQPNRATRRSPSSARSGVRPSLNATSVQNGRTALFPRARLIAYRDRALHTGTRRAPNRDVY